jgi:hypothetical protein
VSIVITAAPSASLISPDGTCSILLFLHTAEIGVSYDVPGSFCVYLISAVLMQMRHNIASRDSIRSLYCLFLPPFVALMFGKFQLGVVVTEHPTIFKKSKVP